VLLFRVIRFARIMIWQRPFESELMDFTLGKSLERSVAYPIATLRSKSCVAQISLKGSPLTERRRFASPKEQRRHGSIR
jgi:hypothetical protein